LKEAENGRENLSIRGKLSPKLRGWNLRPISIPYLEGIEDADYSKPFY